MTSGRASNTDSEGRSEHIRRELEAAEQRELMFLARERNDRMRELTSWFKLDLTAITDKKFIASKCSRDEDVIFHLIISHRNYRHCVQDAGIAGSANEATDGRSCWGSARLIPTQSATVSDWRQVELTVTGVPKL